MNSLPWGGQASLRFVARGNVNHIEVKDFVNSRSIVRLAPVVVLALLTLGCTKTPEIKPTILPSAVQVINGPVAPIVQETDVITNLGRPATLEGRFSYTYGYMLYNTLLQQQGFGDLDANYFAKGALDAAAGTGFFSHDEMAQTLYEVQTQLLQIAQQEVEALAAANLEDAELFLSQNRQNEGVLETDSGLQYEIISEGEGKRPSPESLVEVDYRLSLIEGRVIDSSYERDGAASFRLNGMGVRGFVEGVSLMGEGSHYRFWIHPSLGWGKEGNQLVEPNTLLVLEVTLYSVNE